jgi:transposase-like protein
LTPDSMTVRLKLKRIRVVEVVTDVTEQLEVVVADLRSVVTCPSCGLKTSKVHDTRRVKIKDLPVLGAKTTLIWLRRRFSCDNCGGRHLEDHPAFEGKMTRRLARALVTDARHLSITEITRRYGFSWSTVMALVSTCSARQDLFGPSGGNAGSPADDRRAGGGPRGPSFPAQGRGASDGGPELGSVLPAQRDMPGKLAALAYAFEHLEIAGYEELKQATRRR